MIWTVKGADAQGRKVYGRFRKTRCKISDYEVKIYKL